MHQQLSKQAGIKASGFDDLVKNLQGLQQQGKVFKNHADAENLARHVMYEKGGTGSIVVDATNGILNKVTGKKKVGDIVKRKISNLQRKLTDVDIKAGNKVQETLSKNKVTKKLGNAFVYDHDIPLAKNQNGVADEVVKVSVPALTAPIEKAKKVILPTAGALYLNSQIVDAAENKQNKGGDVVGGVIKESEYRQLLKEKIATALGGSETVKTASVTRQAEDKETELLLKASTLLKTAAMKQKEMESDMLKLANENKKLDEELCIIKKAEEAKTVANLMVLKGLIKKADFQSKVDELTDMEKSAFSMFKSAIENVQPEEKMASGIDDLTFLVGSNNIEVRKTLADSLEDASMELNKR